MNGMSGTSELIRPWFSGGLWLLIDAIDSG